MKMIRLSVFILICLASFQSQASVSFRWYTTTSGDATDQGGANLAVGSLILTYISSDNVVNFDSLSALQSTYGNDTFVSAQATVGPAAGRYTTSTQILGSAGNGAGSYVGSYAYFLIFNMPYASYTSISSIPAGTYYQVSNISGPLTQYDTTPLSTPQSFTPGPVQTSMQVVPEPSSIGLIGIGLAMIAFRRKFLK